MLLWLATYRHGALRTKRGHEGQRHRYRLPRHPWFQGLFSDMDQHLLDFHPRGDQLQTHKICALVEVSRGTVSEGPLTDWDREADFQQAYYLWPADSFVLRVERVVATLDSRSAGFFLRQAARADQDAASKILYADSMVFYPRILDADAWRLPPDVSADSIPCLLLPEALCHLVARGLWKSLVCTGTWVAALRKQGFPSPFGDWPDEEWMQRVCGLVHPPDLSTPFSSEACREIVSAIREFAGKARGIDPDAQMRLSDAVDTVGGWALSLEGARGYVYTDIGKKSVHDSAVLIECIRAARFVGGGASRLKEAACMQIRAVLPPSLGPSLAEEVQQSRTIPSSSALQRHELGLDMSLMLLERRRKESGPAVVRFGWADSSPQGDHNWLWLQHHSIPVESLVPTMYAVFDLALSMESLVAEQDESGPGTGERCEFAFDEEMLGSWAPWLKQIGSSIHEHIHPPADLQSGFEGVLHKAAAMTWSLAMECPSRQALRQVVLSFASFTTDMGVEVGLSDLRQSADQLVPSWLELDNDEDLCLDVACQDIVPVAVDEDKHFLPNAITVAGLQHVTSNLTEDVDKEMELWKEFYPKLANLQNFLIRAYRRSRFVWTCLRGTAFASEEHRLKHWTAALYKARWHEVTIFLRDLQPLLPLLRQTWDHRRYESGKDRQLGVGPLLPLFSCMGIQVIRNVVDLRVVPKETCSTAMVTQYVAIEN